MSYRHILLLAPLLLAGCAPGATGSAASGVLAACPGTADPVPADAPCGLVCRAELPVVVTRNGSPLVDVWIDDKPARMLLDTGASRSGLLAGSVARLGLPSPVAASGFITGVGGVQARSTVSVRSISFGHVRLQARPFDVFGMGKAGVQPVAADAYDGILGADYFRGDQLDLDLPHNVVRLDEGRSCPGPLPGWKHEDGTAPFVPWVQSGHTIVDAQLDAAPVTAMLDTGADNTVVGLDTAHAHGASDAEMGSDMGVQLVGVGPALVAGRIHRFTSLAVGPETIPQPETFVAVLGLKRPELVIGMDFLGTHKVWIDYAGRVVYFAHDW